jgi:hypothetical protein
LHMSYPAFGPAPSVSLSASALFLHAYTSLTGVPAFVHSCSTRIDRYNQQNYLGKFSSTELEKMLAALGHPVLLLLLLLPPPSSSSSWTGEYFIATLNRIRKRMR